MDEKKKNVQYCAKDFEVDEETNKVLYLKCTTKSKKRELSVTFAQSGWKISNFSRHVSDVHGKASDKQMDKFVTRTINATAIPVSGELSDSDSPSLIINEGRFTTAHCTRFCALIKPFSRPRTRSTRIYTAVVS
jgi:hypothetical protein